MSSPDASCAAAGPYAWGISLIASVMALGNVLLGGEVLAEPQRYGGASFRYITNGETDRAALWGAAFILFGAAALFGQYTHRKWPTRVAHSASAVACLVWGMSFALATMRPETAEVARSGVVAYALMIAPVHAIVAVVSPHRVRQ